MSDAKDTSDASFQDQDWKTVVKCNGIDYTVTVSQEQKSKAALLIKPKPVKTEANAKEVLDDHRQAVQNIAMFVINAILCVIMNHDIDHLNQTPEEHHKEPHHSTFNPEAIPESGLCIWFVVEALCDYIATVFGRAMAGREFDILLPETQLDGWGSMISSLLSMIHWMGIATVTPEPAPLPGVQSEWRDGA